VPFLFRDLSGCDVEDGFSSHEEIEGRRVM
jgi:hypothetical protein